MKTNRRELLAGLLAAPFAYGQGQTSNLPNIGLKADSGPTRSECGIGALMPWADALWAVTYNSHKSPTGSGLGLYRIDENLKTELIHVHNGTHANRFIHTKSADPENGGDDRRALPSRALRQRQQAGGERHHDERHF